MPAFMFKTRSGTGYQFRRGVPEDVRQSIGKREFKFKLSGDFRAACRECELLACETTEQIKVARGGLKNLRKNHFHVWDDLEVIEEVTPELVQQFYSTILATTEIADMQRREALSVGQEPEIGTSEAVTANSTADALLREAFKTGDCGAFRHVTHQTLHFAGYRLAEHLHGTASEGKLLLAFVRAQLAGIKVVTARYEGEDPEVKFPAAPLKRVTEVIQEVQGVPQTMMLSAAINEFLAQLPPAQLAMNEKHRFILPASALYIA
jgi:hypothetical protein